MDKELFIKDLNRRRSIYANPEQASTQAQSLNLLSSGIYTEEERFVFELIQNAVDAYNGTDFLDIKLVLTNEFLIFMHNGDAFSQRDVEGLCDVGNGNKMKDAKKIGYKGIGFKSVFMHSHCVTVESGGFCFRFDKDYWKDYWDPSWPDKKQDKNYYMPWQIIPIESSSPFEIDSSGYNVITYIQTNKSQGLHEKITKLLSSSNFLLFLRHANITINYSINDELVLCVKKSTSQNVVNLYTNNELQSSWLVYTNEAVCIPDSIKRNIKSDGITPIKLQEANSFDLSFAVPLNSQGQIEALKESVVYTYLPTSISFGFPFIVNANFITDAGRQHLVKDSEWNRMIISQIPKEFLVWMSRISKEMNTYYKVLPSKIDNADKLGLIFNNALVDAIETTAFIPSETSGLLKAKEAVMDCIGISDVIGKEKLLAHINNEYKSDYTENAFVPLGGRSVLRRYGVFDFEAEKLIALFDDDCVFDGITIILPDFQTTA